MFTTKFNASDVSMILSINYILYFVRVFFSCTLIIFEFNFTNLFSIAANWTYLTNPFFEFQISLFIYCSLWACPYNYQSEIFSKVVRSILILPQFFLKLIFIKVQSLEKLLNIVRIYLQRIPMSLKNAGKFINTIFECWFYFIIGKNLLKFGISSEVDEYSI